MSAFKPGDPVTYVPYHADGDRAHPDCEDGTVTTITARGTIFVRFEGRFTAQGCTADQLVHRADDRWLDWHSDNHEFRYKGTKWFKAQSLNSCTARVQRYSQSIRLYRLYGWGWGAR